MNTFTKFDGHISHLAFIRLLGQESIPDSPRAPNSVGKYELCLGAALAEAATFIQKGRTAAAEFVSRLEHGGTKETIIEQVRDLGIDPEPIRDAVVHNDKTPSALRFAAFLDEASVSKAIARNDGTASAERKGTFLPELAAA